MSKFTDDSRATTGDILSWTSAPWKSGQPVSTDIHWIDSEHLLETADCGNVGIHSKTWTDQLLLDGREVIHSTLIIHTVSHIQNFLTTTPLLSGNVGKTLHLPLTRNFHNWLEVISFDNLRIL
jgi:hypothetical protein